MEKIKCTIERITFQNPENGYSVLQTTIKGYREEQTVVGIFHEVTVGAVLTVEGTGASTSVMAGSSRLRSGQRNSRQTSSALKSTWAADW